MMLGVVFALASMVAMLAIFIYLASNRFVDFITHIRAYLRARKADLAGQSSDTESLHRLEELQRFETQFDAYVKHIFHK